MLRLCPVAVMLALGSFVPYAASQPQPTGCLTCQVGPGTTILTSYGFEDVTVIDSTVCDTGGFSTQHAITTAAGSTSPVVQVDTQFTTYFADTLCADGTQAMHAADCTTTTGAKIGVVNNASPRVGPGGTDYASLASPEGSNFFQIEANGVDGFTYVCFEPFAQSATNTVASIQVYNAQAGWHEEADKLRVWAEVTGSAGVQSAVTMMPQETESPYTCTAEATKHNIDSLLLRDSASQTAWTGAHNVEGDPAILPDSFVWKTLSAELGTVASVKVCAGLQTGAGHEILWLDDYKLTAGALSTATCPINVPGMLRMCVRPLEQTSDKRCLYRAQTTARRPLAA